MKIVFAFILFLLTFNISAQTLNLKEVEEALKAFDEAENQWDGIFVDPEQTPEFVGGEAALLKFIEDHTKYPRKAKCNKIEGKVMIGFNVDYYTGVIRDIHVVKPLEPSLNKEALRVIKKLPKFKPCPNCIKLYKKVKPKMETFYVVPVVFELEKK